MRKMWLRGVLAIAGAALVLPAFAQSGQPAAADGTIQALKGAAMVSVNGQPYATVTANQTVPAGAYLMVPNDASATVHFGNGCTESYDKAGIYQLGGRCNLLASSTTTSATGATDPASADASGAAASTDWPAAVTMAVVGAQALNFVFRGCAGPNCHQPEISPPVPISN